MNHYTRNTILYSFLTLSLVGSYWHVRQQAQDQDVDAVSSEQAIEIHELATEGYREQQGLLTDKQNVLVSHYRQ